MFQNSHASMDNSRRSISEQSDEYVKESQLTTPDTPKIIALLEEQVQDLKAQLDTANTEKAQLLEILSAEKEEKRALMPPIDEKQNLPTGCTVS